MAGSRRRRGPTSALASPANRSEQAEKLRLARKLRAKPEDIPAIPDPTEKARMQKFTKRRTR